MAAVDSEVRRLIAEAGLVAVNHGFIPEARAIREALRDLVDAPRLRNLLDAAMLIGLGEHEEAARRLNGDESVEAETLRMLLKPKYAKPAGVPPALLEPHTNGISFDK
jgi:type III secretion system SsaH family protein